jgi:hypothetical protein
MKRTVNTMKWLILIICALIVLNIFVAVRFRMPMAFVLASAGEAVVIYCYLTSDNKKK